MSDLKRRPAGFNHPSRVDGEAQLVLKPSSIGNWIGDDFDVLVDGIVVGRIMKAVAAPEETPYMWIISAYNCHEDRTQTHGYEPTQETAFAAFAKSWRRE